ncbi:MAG: M48 family metalloprotease [Theionarchaea archaeon]|nr:M48 family metalloprotease [Theionarchaea archaeon]
MYYILVAGLALGILFILFSWQIGERKKIIDQFESDVRIFLVLILIVSFYSLFLSISMLYLNFFISTGELNYFVTFLYFLFPPLLGISLYGVLPWFCGRALHLKESPVPEKVRKISRMLGLTEIPQVKTSPLKVPPLVYGRRKNSSALVLPENMESFLTEEEQEAVIAHELSHVNQGDVGFFTWLTLLTKGFTYWMLPFPVVLIFGMGPYIFNPQRNPALIGLIPLFFVSTIFLKNSLSRTRESIADAYVIFHGLETPLKEALFKYAALRTAQRGCTFSLCFYHETRLKSVLATHPPLRKRLHTIDEKTFLLESTTNLSCELAFWIGLVSAFLFYNVMYSLINFSVVVDAFISVPVDVSDGIYITNFFAVMGVVGASYIFPSTKGSVLFSDIGNPTFFIPLVRNWGITAVTAASILYGLTTDVQIVQGFIPSVLAGFLLWIMGFASSRPTDFSKGTWYLILGPIFSGILLWYPVKLIYFFFSTFFIDFFRFTASMLGAVVLTLLIFLVLMETGHVNTDREERFILLLGKKMEFPHISDAAFIFLANVLSFSVPAGVSLLVYAVSCFFDTFKVFPEMSFFFGVILILLIYGLKKSDILFFLEISYLTDILQGNIHEEDVQFIQKVIKDYQSPDGGFDYAGLNFSNQRDTFHVIKTAKTLSIPLEPERVAEWIYSTEKRGGFALVTGGYLRIEAAYYALQSLSMLGFLKDMSKVHVQWVYDSFNGHSFDFENDTHSLLLQTCYAVEVLSLLAALDYTISPCAQWIETHFSDNLKPKEAFFAVRALKILNSDTKSAEKWLTKNKSLAATRLDKNTEGVYYYVKVLSELDKKVPSLIVEQAAQELDTLKQKYKGKFKL